MEKMYIVTCNVGGKLIIPAPKEKNVLYYSSNRIDILLMPFHPDVFDFTKGDKKHNEYYFSSLMENTDPVVRAIDDIQKLNKLDKISATIERDQFVFSIVPDEEDDTPSTLIKMHAIIVSDQSSIDFINSLKSTNSIEFIKNYLQ